MALPFLLQALTLAPQIFEAGKEIYTAVTGNAVDTQSPAELVNHIERLPLQQQEAIIAKVLDAKVQYQRLDTERFKALTSGDADHVRATARPQIALRCMAMMELPFKVLVWMLVLACGEWVIEGVALAFGRSVDVPSLFAVFAQVDGALAAQVMGTLLVPGFMSAVLVIRKYMGCRERDKAIEYEIQHGKPLKALDATINAASGIASLVSAIKR